MTDPDRSQDITGALDILRDAMRASPISPKTIVEFALEVCSTAGFPQTTPELDAKHRALGLLCGKAAPTSADLTHYLRHIMDGNIPLSIVARAFGSMDRLEFRGPVGEQTRAVLDAAGGDIHSIFGSDILKNLAVIMRSIARRAVDMTTAGLEGESTILRSDKIAAHQAAHNLEADLSLIREAYVAALGEPKEVTAKAISEHITALTGSDKALAWHHDLWSRVVGAPDGIVPGAKLPQGWLELVEAPMIDALRTSAQASETEVERLRGLLATKTAGAAASDREPMTDMQRSLEVSLADIDAERIGQAVAWCTQNAGRGLAAELAQDAALVLQSKLGDAQASKVGALCWAISQALHIGAETAIAWADHEQRRVRRWAIGTDTWGETLDSPGLAVEQAWHRVFEQAGRDYAVRVESMRERLRELEGPAPVRSLLLAAVEALGWTAAAGDPEDWAIAEGRKLAADRKALSNLRATMADAEHHEKALRGCYRSLAEASDPNAAFASVPLALPNAETQQALLDKARQLVNDAHACEQPRRQVDHLDSMLETMLGKADEVDMQRIKDLLHERRVRLAVRDGEACSWPELVKGLISDHYTGEQNEQVFRSQIASAEQRATASEAKSGVGGPRWCCAGARRRQSFASSNSRRRLLASACLRCRRARIKNRIWQGTAAKDGSLADVPGFNVHPGSEADAKQSRIADLESRLAAFQGASLTVNCTRYSFDGKSWTIAPVTLPVA